MRYVLSQLIQTKTIGFPYGTLTVNVVGCLLIGLVYGMAEKMGLSNEWKLFLATGVIGGFTTFSAFSFESISLIRDGHAGSAMIYIICSVALGLLATWLGILAVNYLK